jgi:hypothetical protein
MYIIYTIFNSGGVNMEVNKIIYIVLAFFLGGFGVHKFYAGKTNRLKRMQAQCI